MNEKYTIEKKALDVRLKMQQSAVIHCFLLVPRDKTLADVMNGHEHFIEIEFENTMRLINRAQIDYIMLNEAPRTKGMQAPDSKSSNPYALLGLNPNASLEEARKKYHELVKIYHPDRFNGVDLPPEMHEYAQSMIARINWAYEEIERK